MASEDKVLLAALRYGVIHNLCKKKVGCFKTPYSSEALKIMFEEFENRDVALANLIDASIEYADSIEKNK